VEGAVGTDHEVLSRHFLGRTVYNHATASVKTALTWNRYLKKAQKY